MIIDDNDIDIVSVRSFRQKNKDGRDIGPFASSSVAEKEMGLASTRTENVQEDGFISVWQERMNVSMSRPSSLQRRNAASGSTVNHAPSVAQMPRSAALPPRPHVKNQIYLVG